MARLLLVHGSCFGGWAWDRVIPALAALGHSARAIDLPGRDGAGCTLADHARAIGAALDGPTVLVGHSAGGYSITAAAEMAGRGVAGLIYLAAYVPQTGRSLADLRRSGPSQPMRGAFELSADRVHYRFRPERCADLFFHDCPDPAAATARMGPEPLAPQETPFPALHRAPAPPCAAIICTADRAIPPDWQRQMAKGMPQTDLPSGHCPFLSMPERLAAVLDLALNGPGFATGTVAD